MPLHPAQRPLRQMRIVERERQMRAATDASRVCECTVHGHFGAMRNEHGVPWLQQRATVPGRGESLPGVSAGQPSREPGSLRRHMGPFEPRMPREPVRKPVPIRLQLTKANDVHLSKWVWAAAEPGGALAVGDDRRPLSLAVSAGSANLFQTRVAQRAPRLGAGLSTVMALGEGPLSDAFGVGRRGSPHFTGQIDGSCAAWVATSPRHERRADHVGILAPASTWRRRRRPEAAPTGASSWPGPATPRPGAWRTTCACWRASLTSRSLVPESPAPCAVSALARACLMIMRVDQS